MASQVIHAQVTNKRVASTNAERDSILPWPKGWAGSAGLSDNRTEIYVTTAATRSKPECMASEMIPKLLVKRPTVSFIAINRTAATTEVKATVCFSGVGIP